MQSENTVRQRNIIYFQLR